MKVFAIVLLCAFAAVQGRGVEKATYAAQPGDNPGLVHLRIAVSTSGFLESCVGTLIDNQWILTAASCVRTSRFIWTRYNAVNVINPELVTETSVTDTNNNVRINQDLALVSITRFVEYTDTISPYNIGNEVPSSANFCYYKDQSEYPGEFLTCSDISLSPNGGLFDSTAEVSQKNVGAPLAVDGKVSAILINDKQFLPIADYLPWINQITGLSLGQ